jgi:anti-sigma regulatory factor (Ser/Thr protein kinase)
MCLGLRGLGSASDGIRVNVATGLDERTAQSWSWALPFHLTSVPRARRLVSQALTDRSIRPDVVADSRSVVSELVGNALRHARPRPDGGIEVTLKLDDASILVSVADGGAATVPSVVSPAPMARSGRGLGIVHTLTRDWGVRESSDGNTVFGILGRR